MKTPFISFIIPTYNAERYLEKCLRSVFTQDYPRDQFEVLIADGGSSDKTLEIIRNYPEIRLFKNKKRIAEYGKYICYKHAKGEYIILLDSDNIIDGRTWLNKMVRPLEENSNLLGVESNYFIGRDFTSLNTYATLLVIVDPLARMLASEPYKLEDKGDYIIKHYEKKSSPVSGANGFIWRRDLIEKYIKGRVILNEANMLNEIARDNSVSIGNVPGAGIYHYYCESLNDWIRKRKKIANKFLNRRNQSITWVDTRGKAKLIIYSVYLATIIGPTIEAILNFQKSRRREWVWHPLISFLTVFIYLFYFLKKIVEIKDVY